MARVSKMACDNHRCPDFLFPLPNQHFCIVKKYIYIYICIYICICIYTYIHTYICVEIVYLLPLLPNDTASETFLHKSRRDAKFWLDIYQWGASLAFTGRIHDIGRKFYNLLFKQEVVAAPSYFQIFFLIAFLNEAFIINVIIILCIHYKIIICINDNNAVINNN
jgi:hypothetical protein